MATDRKPFRDAVANSETRPKKDDVLPNAKADKATRDVIARESSTKYRSAMFDLNRSSDREIDRALQGT